MHATFMSISVAFYVICLGILMNTNEVNALYTNDTRQLLS